MIIYVIQKYEVTKNSPDSIYVMVNYYYHGENRGNYPLIPVYAVNNAIIYLHIQERIIIEFDGGNINV